MTEPITTRPVAAQIQHLPSLGTELLEQARDHPSRRAARTIASGSSLRSTVIALASGAELAEHEAPPAATLQVLHGRVRLHWHGGERLLGPGDVTDIPPARHALLALTDAAVLLTVALGAGPSASAPTPTAPGPTQENPR